MPAAVVMDSDFVAQDLIVRNMSYIRTGTPEERKYC